MKVLHTISGMSISGGGPSQSVFYTVSGLRQQGVDATILTYLPREGDSFVANEDFIKTLPVTALRFAYSPLFKKYLLNHPFDLYHAQAIWQYPACITAKIARKFNKPYIITPRGMLYPHALTISALKKKIALKLFQRNDLQNATCLHATCVQEMQHIRNLGLKSPIAVIPNCLNINHSYTPLNGINKKKRFGFVGRIHPIKNIDGLLKAWIKLKNLTQNAELVITGNGDVAYENELHQLLADHHVKNVWFAGFLAGEALESAIRTLDYLVLPSHSENFGMVVPEALMMGIPVIASKGTPWEELNTHRCGWWVDNNVDTLTATIEEAIRTSEDKRCEMGQNGRRLVIENYSIEVVAKKMTGLYKWILNGCGKPEFVHV